MFVKALKSRLVASRSIFILLVIATTWLQHAAATSSSTESASSTDSLCVTELAACYGDTDCLGCITAGYGDAYTECVASYEYDGSDYCAASSAEPCCLDSVSTNDCLGNDAFEEYSACFVSTYSIELGGDECSTITCSDDTVDELVDDTVDDLVDDTSGVGSCSPSVMLTCVLGVAFLTAASQFDVFV